MPPGESNLEPSRCEARCTVLPLLNVILNGITVLNAVLPRLRNMKGK